MCKKITALVLAFALLCSVSACGAETAQREAQAAEMLNAIYYEEFETAYALMHQSSVSREEFEEIFIELVMQMAGVTWDFYSTVSVDIDGAQETCRLAVTLKDERQLILEYVYLTSPEGEGFTHFVLIDN